MILHEPVRGSITLPGTNLDRVEIRSCSLYSPEIPTVLLAGVVNDRFKLQLVEIHESHLRVRELDLNLFTKLLDDPKIKDIESQKKLLAECERRSFVTFCSRFSRDVAGRVLGIEPMTKIIVLSDLEPQQVDVQKIYSLIDTQLSPSVKENVVMSYPYSTDEVKNFPVILMRDPRIRNDGERSSFLITKPADSDNYSLCIGIGGHANVGIAVTRSYKSVMQESPNQSTDSIVQIDGHAQIITREWLHLSMRNIINSRDRSCWMDIVRTMKEPLSELGFSRFTAGFSRMQAIEF